METMNFVEVVGCTTIAILIMSVVIFFIWWEKMGVKNPFIESRKNWLLQKFSVNTSEPLFILEDGRRILSKYVSSDDEMCVFVEKNWKLCDNDRQEFDRILLSRDKTYYYSSRCVIVSKDYVKFGVFNTELKKLIVPVEYRYNQLFFDEEKGVYIKIAPYADKAFTYKGESVHPW